MDKYNLILENIETGEEQQIHNAIITNISILPYTKEPEIDTVYGIKEIRTGKEQYKKVITDGIRKSVTFEWEE